MLFFECWLKTSVLYLQCSLQKASPGVLHLLCSRIFLKKIYNPASSKICIFVCVCIFSLINHFFDQQSWPRRASSAPMTSVSTLTTRAATSTGSVTTTSLNWKPAEMDLPSMPQTPNSSAKTATTFTTLNAETDQNLVRP